MTFKISFEAALNPFALSEMILVGIPRQFLTLLTNRSQNPPSPGAFSTINCQVTFLVVMYCLTAVDLMTFKISFEAALNPFALSEIILVGIPRRPTKHEGI